MGQIRIIPGPFMPVKRPSVNITTRSYSLSSVYGAEEQQARR